jgi:pyrroloquinoline-quinone synthase
MSFWDRLDAVRAECNVLDHPFYVRWSRGELSPEELAAYAGQYRHAVVALAQASATAAGQAEGALRVDLEEHAAQEAAHVDLWDSFLDAAGGDATASASEDTAACAQTWAGPARALAPTLAALYAIEAGQPAIADAKRQGLVDLYGFEPGPATAYFDLHAELDHEHAAGHRQALEALRDEATEEELIEAARSVLRANWRLLDGVEAAGRA